MHPAAERIGQMDNHGGKPQVIGNRLKDFYEGIPDAQKALGRTPKHSQNYPEDQKDRTHEDILLEVKQPTSTPFLKIFLSERLEP